MHSAQSSVVLAPREYYEPPQVFRQPAIIVKKRANSTNCIKDSANIVKAMSNPFEKRHWSHDLNHKMRSQVLRQVSDDFNDCYTTKKVASDFFSLHCTSVTHPNDISSSKDGLLLIANSESTENLKLYQVTDNNSLRELQGITVPGAKITSVCMLSYNRYKQFSSVQEHDVLFLTGHQDGIVNLISTSKHVGGAKIIKRFNHVKYLRSTMDYVTLESMLRPFASTPVIKLKPWNDTGFVSMVNDSIFVYDMEKSHKAPQYLNSFSGLQSFAINEASNPYLLSLCGSEFGSHNIALLDLRNGLYIPSIDDIQEKKSIQISLDCLWLDGSHVAQAVNTMIQIWNVESTSPSPVCKILPERGYIEKLAYDQEKLILYSGDDQGHIISWDLREFFTGKMKTCGLVHGLKSIRTTSEYDVLTSMFQNGNIISHSAGAGVTSGKIVYLDLLKPKGQSTKLLSFDSIELGLHEVVDIQYSLALPYKVKKEVSRTMSDPEYELSDVSTLLHHSHESDSDCVSGHTTENDEDTMAMSKSFYNNNDIAGSGSTIGESEANTHARVVSDSNI